MSALVPVSFLPFVAKQYIMQQKCPKKWIGSLLLGTRRYNFQPLIVPVTDHAALITQFLRTQPSLD